MNPKATLKIAKAINNLLSRSKESTEDKGKGKRVVIILLLFIFFIVPVTALSLPGLIFKGVMSKIKSAVGISDKKDEVVVEETIEYKTGDEDYDFNIENSEIYRLIRNVYILNNTDIEKEFDKYISEIEEKYTYKFETEYLEYTYDKDGKIKYDKKGKPITKKNKYEAVIEPNIIKDVQLHKPDIQLVLAYIGTKYLSVQTDDDEYIFDEEEIREFLRSVTEIHTDVKEIKVDENGTSKEVKVTYYTTIKETATVSNMYFTDDDQVQQYLISYDSFSSMNDFYINQSIKHIDYNTLTIYANGINVPHYLQYDNEWADFRYGTGTISNCGCGPTCMAMILSYYSKSALIPPEVVKWVSVQPYPYYTEGEGTNWCFFGDIARDFRIRCERINVDAAILTQTLCDGIPIIASVKPGTFTNSGHFIVLRGITGEGNILVNDPNDNIVKKFYQQEFSLPLILNESKAMWKFEK